MILLYRAETLFSQLLFFYYSWFQVSKLLSTIFIPPKNVHIHPGVFINHI